MNGAEFIDIFQWTNWKFVVNDKARKYEYFAWYPTAGRSRYSYQRGFRIMKCLLDCRAALAISDQNRNGIFCRGFVDIDIRLLSAAELYTLFRIPNFIVFFRFHIGCYTGMRFRCSHQNDIKMTFTSRVCRYSLPMPDIYLIYNGRHVLEVEFYRIDKGRIQTAILARYLSGIEWLKLIRKWESILSILLRCRSLYWTDRALLITGLYRNGTFISALTLKKSDIYPI